jgi:hypothetical protein
MCDATGVDSGPGCRTDIIGQTSSTRKGRALTRDGPLLASGTKTPNTSARDPQARTHTISVPSDPGAPSSTSGPGIGRSASHVTCRRIESTGVAGIVFLFYAPRFTIAAIKRCRASTRHRGKHGRPLFPRIKALDALPDESYGAGHPDGAVLLRGNSFPGSQC